MHARQLGRLEALIASLGVKNANQGSQCFENITPSMTQPRARVQVPCESVLCFKHEASLCSGLSKPQWGHCGMIAGEAK